MLVEHLPEPGYEPVIHDILGDYDPGEKASVCLPEGEFTETGQGAARLPYAAGCRLLNDWRKWIGCGCGNIRFDDKAQRHWFVRMFGKHSVRNG